MTAREDNKAGKSTCHTIRNARIKRNQEKIKEGDKKGIQEKESEACEWEHENMAREKGKCVWNARTWHYTR